MSLILSDGMGSIDMGKPVSPEAVIYLRACIARHGSTPDVGDVTNARCWQEMLSTYPDSMAGPDKAASLTVIQAYEAQKKSTPAGLAEWEAWKKEAAPTTGDGSTAKKIAVVETGVDTGKILGMDSKTFLLVAGAGLLLMMNSD